MGPSIFAVCFLLAEARFLFTYTKYFFYKRDLIHDEPQQIFAVSEFLLRIVEVQSEDILLRQMMHHHLPLVKRWHSDRALTVVQLGLLLLRHRTDRFRQASSVLFRKRAIDVHALVMVLSEEMVLVFQYIACRRTNVMHRAQVFVNNIAIKCYPMASCTDSD